MDDWLIRWADAVTYDELFARRRFKFVGDQEAKGDMSAFEMLVHIINHTTYHRGWAVQMLMEPGNSRPSTTTDLPVYLRDVGRVDPQRDRGSAMYLVVLICRPQLACMISSPG